MNGVALSAHCISKETPTNTTVASTALGELPHKKVGNLFRLWPIRYFNLS